MSTPSQSLYGSPQPGSARCVLYSVDFADIEHPQNAGQWDAAGRLLSPGRRLPADCRC